MIHRHPLLFFALFYYKLVFYIILVAVAVAVAVANTAYLVLVVGLSGHVSFV